MWSKTGRTLAQASLNALVDRDLEASSWMKADVRLGK
jgi:hypothetical protein